MPLSFHSALLTELSEIRAWYVERTPSLSAVLLADLETALLRIERYPQMYARHHELRRLQLTRFPCHLYYHVRPNGDVYIVGAAHAYADPAATLAKLTDRL